jgi:hypothetical protein
MINRRKQRAFLRWAQGNMRVNAEWMETSRAIPAMHAAIAKAELTGDLAPIEDFVKR